MTDQLTPHFKLSEYLATDRVEFQEKNRIVTPEQINKLRQLAILQEHVRDVIGFPLHNHSGYRCLELNAAVGSSSRSQHLLCEAVDFDRYGADYTEESLDVDFRAIMAAAKGGRLKFGQLIKESAPRYTKAGKGVSRWLHISLGAPWRPAERCGQCLTMVNGVYTSLGTV
jgi:zinc D-Ala-D-Ala carboxypeptidase